MQQTELLPGQRIERIERQRALVGQYSLVAAILALERQTELALRLARIGLGLGPALAQRLQRDPVSALGQGCGAQKRELVGIATLPEGQPRERCDRDLGRRVGHIEQRAQPIDWRRVVVHLAAAQPEGQDADQPATAIEQPAAAGARGKPVVALDHRATIEPVQADDLAFAELETEAAGVANRQHRIAPVQRCAEAEHGRCRVEPWHVQQAEVMVEVGPLAGDRVAQAAAQHGNSHGLASDVAAGDYVFGADHDRRTDRIAPRHGGFDLEHGRRELQVHLAAELGTQRTECGGTEQQRRGCALPCHPRVQGLVPGSSSSNGTP